MPRRRLESFPEIFRRSDATSFRISAGPTEALFFERAGSIEQNTKLARASKDDAAEVAREGFEALIAGKDHVVAGSFMNKVEAAVAHVLPDKVTAQIHRKQTEPGSGGD